MYLTFVALPFGCTLVVSTRGFPILSEPTVSLRPPRLRKRAELFDVAHPGVRLFCSPPGQRVQKVRGSPEKLGGPTLTQRLLLLLLAIMLTAGCGGGGGGTQPAAVTPPPSTAPVVLRHPVNGAMPVNVTHVTFTGIDAAGSVVYGPHTRPVADEITLDLPVLVRTLRIEYLQGSNLLGSVLVTLFLQPGQETVLDDPDVVLAAPVLQTLAVSPAEASIADGTTQQFSVLGTYSDGSELDLTSAVAWSTGNAGVATVSNETGSRGRATAQGTGQTRVTANLGQVSGSADLTVTAAVLASIQVTPGSPAIPKGLTQQFAATGTFTDGSLQDLTTGVAWASTDESVATIGADGLASGAASGQATISATSGPISGSTVLTVTPAVLVGLAITPDNLSIPRHFTGNFGVTGTYSDGSLLDLTSVATWSSDLPGVAEVSNLTGSWGRATAIDEGQATLTASLQGFSDTTTVTVFFGTEILSLSPTGQRGNSSSSSSECPAPNFDGRYVAYGSSASNLVPGDTNGNSDVFVYDRSTSTNRRVNTSASDQEANGFSYKTDISGDGRYVVFQSFASNLVAGDTNGSYDIYVKDLQDGSIDRVSVSSAGAQGNGHSQDPMISADGRYVVFHSAASTLVAGDTNGADDVFRHDRDTGATVRVSVSTGGTQGNGGSNTAGVSGDGRLVVFNSTANNLVAGDTNGQQDVFLRDLQANTTVRASRTSTGGESNSSSFLPAISANGARVTFGSNATNMVAQAVPNGDSIYLYDVATGAVTLGSTNAAGVSGNSYSDFSRLSADARYLVFDGGSTNLAPGDTDSDRDVFVKDLTTGVVALASVDSFGTKIADFGDDAIARPSGDGRFIAFRTNSPILDPRDSGSDYDVYLTLNRLWEALVP